MTAESLIRSKRLQLLLEKAEIRGTVVRLSWEPFSFAQLASSTITQLYQLLTSKDNPSAKLSTNEIGGLSFVGFFGEHLSQQTRPSMLS
jgi:hypothetical protein